MTFLTPKEFTIFTAFADVQQTSVSALTSAEVFTYETTGTPGYRFFKFLTSSPVLMMIKSNQPSCQVTKLFSLDS